MNSMHTQFQIKPSDSTTLIQPSATGASGGAVVLECHPVVCRVPERASHTNDARLYIVFEGRLEIEHGDDGSSLRTRAFSTNFAYFEVGADKVVHRLGGHYDFSLTPLGHPVTHMQLRSQADFVDHIFVNFRSVNPDLELINGMEEVLNQFRAPSAQVDFLGFLLQIGADHLIDDKSGDEVKATFRALLNSCSPVSGVSRMHDASECNCAHSVHLYAT